MLNLCEVVSNTFLVMTFKRRLFSLKEMILQFKELYRLHKSELIVEISSAKNLSKPDLEVLKKSISSKIGSDIIIKSKTEPHILGGLIVKVGSKLIDTSIRSKLAKLKNNLKEVG